MYIHICTRLWLYEFLYTHTYVFIYIYIFFIYTYIYIYICFKYIYIYMHIYIHVIIVFTLYFYVYFISRFWSSCVAFNCDLSVCAPLGNPCGLCVCVLFLHKMPDMRITVDDIAIWRKNMGTQFMFSIRRWHRHRGYSPEDPCLWRSVALHRQYTTAGIPNLGTSNLLSCLVV